MAVPGDRGGDVAGQDAIVRGDSAERVERDSAEGDDPGRVEDRQEVGQVGRAVAQLAHARASVQTAGVARVAEDGVGDEDVGAGKTGAAQKLAEVATALVGREGNAGPVPTKAAGRLGDEEDAGVE